MLFADRLVVVRGGGDLASGAIHSLHRAGFPVVVLELPKPMAIRRAVSFATAVTEGSVVVENIKGVLAAGPGEAERLAYEGFVPVLVSPTLPRFERSPHVVVDARMAKENLDTTFGDAPLVVGLGPGFTAGVDCHVVIETKRGHRLGRVISAGSAEPNTGVPGEVGGASESRVVRAPADGLVAWHVDIGDVAATGQPIGDVGGVEVTTVVAGVVRGLITPGFEATNGMKIADIDPRGDRSACFEISDKARLVGAGVLEGILHQLNQDAP